MPIRQVEMDDNLRIWRSFSIGSLFDLVMLDSRQYDRSITDLYWNTDYVHSISNEAGRTMVSAKARVIYPSNNLLTFTVDSSVLDKKIGSTTAYQHQQSEAQHGA